MIVSPNQDEIITFSPGLHAGDPVAVYWLRQVTVRLRREIAWCWNERGLTPDSTLPTLPPFADEVTTTLDMRRYAEERHKFFSSHPTARHLTEQLQSSPPRIEQPAQGSFSWVVQRLDLDDVSAFVLALGLAVAFDNAMGSVIAACLNDPAKTRPNLALAQKLWHRPEQILYIADPAHPLFRHGLLQPGDHTARSRAEIDWDSPIAVPALVAPKLLLSGSAPEARSALTAKGGTKGELTDGARLVASRLSAVRADSLQVVPVCGPRGSTPLQTARDVAALARRQIREFSGDPRLLKDTSYLNSLATLCWLKDEDLYLSHDLLRSFSGDDQRLSSNVLPLQTIPITLFLGITDRSRLADLPADLLLPVVDVPQLSYQQRIGQWKKALGSRARGLDSAISECARRFRYEKETINSVAEALKCLRRPLTDDDLTAACRAEIALDTGDLAQRVTPRFQNEELVLRPPQALQFQEIVAAMRSLTEVHYGWGTARVWNESGISVLFSGPPGTGKTMAAEILAIKLNLPMYRIDLSQVVNKYIGETEKNLKRVFDAADVSDAILFFDEADALFGRRTEVKDSHDRYANLEISYLLERMERFKGLAILATNRRKDIDEAFLRRLRYILTFPMPGVEERKKIWRQVIPGTVDISKLDIDFLATQFPLTGGHIRSIAFNACLQSADGSASPGDKDGLRAGLTMEKVLIAVKREYDKSNRSVSLDQFGPYAQLVRGLEEGP